VTTDGGSSWTTRPCSRMTSRSARVMASSGSWVISRTGPAKASRCRRSSWRTIRRVSTSRAESGSSSSSRAGSVASARARATRWVCPPESAPGLAPAWSVEPDPLQPVAGPVAGVVARDVAGPQPEGHVLQGGEVGEQQVLLEHDPDGAFLRAQPQAGLRVLERAVAERDPSAVDREQAGQRTEQGGLAGAVGAEDRDDLAGFGVDRHVEVERAEPQRHLGVEAVRGGPLGAAAVVAFTWCSGSGRAGRPARRPRRRAG
jgi:hypothetical protein